MKTTKYLSFLAAAVLVLSATGCASEDAAQDKKDNGQKPNTNGLTEFVTGDMPATRTSLTHTTLGGGCNYFWENNDKIYVIDDDGITQTSNALASTTQAARAKFYLPGKYANTNKHKVRYTGSTGTADKVTIAATQFQSAANSTAHLGASGDCGVAEADRDGDRFSFQLEHKAAYLCFLPRTTNTYLSRCKLTKIEVLSDHDIAGTYDFDDNGLKTSTTPANTSKTITLICGSGWPLTATSDINNTNTAYMVIASGTHSLRVRYWLHDDVDHIDGTVTKYIAPRPYDANTITDLTANLDVRNYASDDYYMWDAALNQHYWAGHTSDQPKVKGGYNANYPQNNSDSRWNNKMEGYDDTSGASPAVKASRSCKDCPNVNELLWYVNKDYGDPHWDADELWITMGHLYKGGVWFKKKAAIGSSFNPNQAPDGTDYTKSTRIASFNYYSHHGKPLPSIATEPLSNPSDYFYLPALGYYFSGTLNDVGSDGYYWSSTPAPWVSNDAYHLRFYKDYVYVTSGYSRNNGFRRWAAQ